MKDQIAELGKEGDASRTLQTMPGVGPITALAIEAFAPAMESFKRGRDFAAWLGLVPRQASAAARHGSGAYRKPGSTTSEGW
ncbi:transposase [Paracoccus sp. (in: a-proteobacteria)]|uniref:transposase n=1 Tax=Paracoccus sp. TaxID=267 RepID=UPI002AFFB69B|nr:transposase [Paracoccus sp. (in: a-proteobacteria)]